MPGHERGAISHNSGIWRRFLHGGDPTGTVWSPGMVDIVLRGKGNHDWFWRPGVDPTVHTVDELMGMYYTSVGRNSNLVIGVVVDNRGLVPRGDARRLGEFGKELDGRFGRAVAETGGAGMSLELRLPKPQKVDHVIIMEDISCGERVQQYEVVGLVSGGTWKPLCKGISVGHKRIEKFAVQEVGKVRLVVQEAKAEPKIRKLAVYYSA